jgi:hypothetical protein
MSKATIWSAGGVLLGRMMAVGLLLGPVTPTAAEFEFTNVNHPGARHYSVRIPDVTLTVGAGGKVEARAEAHCEHGDDTPNPVIDSGMYIVVTRQAGSPPTVQEHDLKASVSARVDHARASASSQILPETTVNGDSVDIAVYTVCQMDAYGDRCNDGIGRANAYATDAADPIVFGSQPYLSWSGLQLNAWPPDSDGVHRYVEQRLVLPAGGFWKGGLPGPSPMTAPDGTRSVNQVVMSQHVRPGSDDDPDNLAGTLAYQLMVTRGPDGGLAVQWLPGADTAEFAFSFSQTAVQIEAGVAEYFAGGGTADLAVGTIRITMLQDEAAMPNMTLLAYDVAQVWAWNTGNPSAFGGRSVWSQSPDIAGGLFRPSSLVLPPFLADDLVCADPSLTRVDGLRWWGTYAGEPWMHRLNAPYVLPFIVQWYASDGAPHPLSLPQTGPPLMMHLVQANRFFVDWAPSGEAIYEFNARLIPSFVPPMAGEYFVSIADPIEPHWMWMESTSARLDMPVVAASPTGPWVADSFPDLSLVLLTAIQPDYDRDGDVDLNDFGFFQACITGPELGPPVPGCEVWDFDLDADVDQSDFGWFQRCISGADQPVAEDCLD